MRRVAVLAASGRELAPMRNVFDCGWTITRGRIGAFRHEVGRAGDIEVHLIRTGVGRDRAREAGETTLSAIGPDALISTGYAGALGVANIGDVIIGTEIFDWTTEQSRQGMQADPELLDRAREAARDARIAWTQGPVVTVDRVVWRAGEKQALGKVSGAIAVDMESAAIAKVASAAGIPFLLVRAISDRAQDDLPMDFNLWFAPFGSLRCLLQVSQRPSVLRGLYEMKRHADQASESLHRVFLKLMAEMPVIVGARSW